MIPKKVFLTKGKGTHSNRLHSFELALRDAGIETCNLVNVSSIVPPNCQIISKKEGMSSLLPGQITFCVLAVHRTKRKNQRIGASIAIAIPEINDSHGYIAEHHQNDCSLDELKRKAEEVAVRMLATTQGIKTSDENKTVTSISLSEMRNQFTVHSITEHVTDTESDKWTTVLAAAVFLF